ncbi:putative enzyme inhibitor [Corchorus capsularis]|uniref:Putative enzyme inhibitor n=1 Tax=Corchorus capsularis TaxID=210143 RepID=A0A1R3JIG0_COCAP|nr:putative enzyme inhibitor [Corchorus capsularis]
MRVLAARKGDRGRCLWRREAEAANLSSSLKSLNDLHSQPALKECLDLFDDASRINEINWSFFRWVCGEAKQRRRWFDEIGARVSV